MRAKFQHAEIAGVIAEPGLETRRLDDEIERYGGDVGQIERIKKTVGLSERRVAAAGETALDLCERAAKKLFATQPSPAITPDAVIFVTQTPDHLQPGNAALLHGRLNFPKTTAAFDVNLGCSGYVYGLYLAFLMVDAGGCENILLCAGDTMSRCVNPCDRAVAPLFGDAGSATWVRRSKKISPSWFVLNTDGTGADAIKIPAGGARTPCSPETATPVTDVDGNLRSPENLAMDGPAVFNFSLREVPAAIREILEFSGKTVSEIDGFILHQANKYILQNIAKRCDIPAEKMPVETLAKYGNTSSASIPTALTEFLADENAPAGELLLSGFGVGLSWASAVLQMK